jgi:hypothetical protein
MILSLSSFMSRNTALSADLNAMLFVSKKHITAGNHSILNHFQLNNIQLNRHSRSSWFMHKQNKNQQV